MPANLIKMGKHGLLRVHHASKSAVSSKTVKESFSRAGIYNSAASYDPSKILSNCTSKISIEEETQIIEAVPKLAKILNQNGKLLDSDYNIRVNEAIQSKDDLTLTRKRTVLLTNAAFVTKEEEKRKKKADDAIDKLEKKRVRKEKADTNKVAKIAGNRNKKSMPKKRNIESDSDSDNE
jgi:hypothetical protein